MTKLRNVFSISLFIAFCSLSLTNLTAQTLKPQAGQSYDVVLQTVIASNIIGEKSDIPQSLTNNIKKLKTDFPFSNYRLASTFIQRIANSGGAEVRSVSYEVVPAQEKKIAVVSEWTINNLQSLPDDEGKDIVQVQSFRFGQRVPILTASNINYEQIGISSKFSLLKNTPTIVGSLTTTKPDELMFLILTVRSAEK